MPKDDQPSNYGSLSVPWLSLVVKADPNFYKDRRSEVEYTFGRRIFKADPNERGAYAPDADTDEERT